MKLAIMQPYFLPYLGYISLVKHTDRFILLDAVQFIRHGWIERNRILKPGGGWQYVRVPLQHHSRGTVIRDIMIRSEEDWARKITAQLQHYKKPAPYYDQVMGLLSDVFSREYASIVDLDAAALRGICDYLDIRTPIEVFSRMGLEIESVQAPDDWALNICRAIGGVTEYWNPSGGIEIFDRSKYESSRIELKFQRVALSNYDQKRTAFEPGLSIIDVLMFNDTSETNRMLDDYELL